MRFAVTTVLAWSAVCLSVGPVGAQEPAPTKPADIYKAAQDLKAEGKFDLAAERFKAFLDASPSDKDFLEVEARFGAATFLKLRNVARWDDNPAADADAKKTADAIIAASVAANRRLNQDPARIARFVRNLGASAAEQEFAVDQLKLAKEAAVPVLVGELLGTNDLGQRAGILTAVPQLPAVTVPGLLASLEGLPDDLKGSMLAALARRPDVIQLTDRAETDLTPHLWYHATSAAPSVKAVARPLLESLAGPATARKSADAELVRLAEPFVRRTAAFGTLDKVANKVTVWQWDADRRTVKAAQVSPAAAEEFYGLRNLRWAVERAPQSEAAQAAFLALATERAVLRANFGDLSKTEPAVYQLLAAAPTGLLTGLLDTALAESRTALAVGVLQGMSDRGQKDVANTPSARTTPYTRALSYPDPRVQFAAAVAILRSPSGAAATESRAKVVDVLRRALLADQDGAVEGKVGRALIADPNGSRGERLAATFREIGYAAERFATGRQLLTRLGKGADFDLVVIDRHVADPTLTDVIGQLAADPNAARRAVFVVASPDRLKPVSVEPLLLRLALMVAATDTATTAVPKPYRFNPRLPDLDPAKARVDTTDLRDVTIAKIFGELEPNPPAQPYGRIARAHRLVEAADLPAPQSLDKHIRARLDHLTMAILAAEHDVTDTSAPLAAKTLAEYTARVKALADQPNPLARIKDAETLERVLQQLDAAMDAEHRAKFDALQRKVLPDAVLIDADPVRDEALEKALARQLRSYPTVSLIPEVFTAVALEQDVKSAVTDPAQLPRTPDEKRATARTAADWLRKIAVGEAAGYDATPAEPAMRSALRLDDLAPLVIDGLAKLGSGDTQQALVTTAIAAGRPLPIRVQAADAAARHAQAFGKRTPAAVADQIAGIAAAEADPILKGKLAVLAQSVSNARADFGGVLQKFPVQLPTPPAPKPEQPKDSNDPAPAKPGDEPKK